MSPLLHDANVQVWIRNAANHFARKPLSDGFTPEALHEYTDRDGLPLYYRIRLKNPITGAKWIRPMHRIGGEFKLSEPKFDHGKLLYALPRVAQNHDAAIWVVEGEQKADALNGLGLTATTSGGATSADACDWRPLTGRVVRLWRDFDDAGKTYEADVAKILAGLDCTVTSVDVDKLGLGVGEDCVDWFLAHPGATGSDVEALPTIAGDWPAPLPLIVSHERLPYPADALPGLLGDTVREVQAFVQCPVALAACSALSVLSVAAQGLVDVQRGDGLSGPVTLYFLVLADSGERKTSCDRIFSAILDEWDAEQRESYRLRIAEHAAKMRTWAAIRDGIEGAIRDAARKNKQTDKLSRDLSDHEANHPAPLFVPSVKHGDITPEELARTLAIGWHSGAILSSEAGVIFGSHGMGSDSVMRNLSLLNILWDGGTVKIERKTSNSFTLAGARLTLGLAAQPDTVRAFFEATKGLARGSGFASRFLLAQPQSTQGMRLYRDGGKLPNTDKYLKRIRELLDTIPSINKRGELIPSVLHLSPEAKTTWVKFYNDVEVELRANGDLVDVKDAASKCADQAARIAALLHILEVGATGAISDKHMQSAAKLAAWHLYEARHVLGEVALPKNLNNAAKLDTWLIQYCRENRTASISTRDIQRLGPNCVRDKLDLDHALSELAEASRAIVRIDGRQKRVLLNPQLMGGGRGAS